MATRTGLPWGRWDAGTAHTMPKAPTSPQEAHRGQQGAQVRDPVALALLAMEVGPLVRALRHWQPVGSLAETVLGAAHGHDALGEHDVQRLRDWSRRWRGLPEALQEFYLGSLECESVSVALWHVLEGRPHDLRPATCGAVHRVYRDLLAQEPPWTLFPRVP